MTTTHALNVTAALPNATERMYYTSQSWKLVNDMLRGESISQVLGRDKIRGMKCKAQKFKTPERTCGETR
jgi:hypothetical protein